MKDHLLQLVQAANPVQGRNIVREYLQARILGALQRAGAMVPLAFQGGTSLRFLFAIPRYSEDLDLPSKAIWPTTISAPIWRRFARLTILMGTSRETSDFIVDGIEHWWQTNQIRLGSIRQLTIDLDNGPANASGRTQFIKRMVAFADRHQLEIELVYYPPYHSKYNPIERCWGMLEQHWNGTLLNSVDTVLEWARTMTWKGVHPVVELLDKTYEKGVRIAKKAFQKFEARLQRDETLPKYFVQILPQLG